MLHIFAINKSTLKNIMVCLQCFYYIVYTTNVYFIITFFLRKIKHHITNGLWLLIEPLRFRFFRWDYQAEAKGLECSKKPLGKKKRHDWNNKNKFEEK